MRIELRINELPVKKPWTRFYDPREDDVRSILMDVCRKIGRGGEFVVSGFGQDPWPADVQTDLPVFLEQLPEILRAVHEMTVVEIDFYEQGLQRSIALSPDSDSYVAVCTSGMTWQPNPPIERIDREDLEEMLTAAKEVFLRAFREMAPGLAGHPWVRRWLEGAGEY
jgi:hypothetical protein